MRVLFVALSPSYLPNFQSTLRLLAERGHELHVGLEEPEGRFPEYQEWLHRLSEDYPTVSYGRAPKRKDSWRALASHLRLGLDYLRYFDERYGEAGDLRARAGRRTPIAMRRIIDVPAVHGPSGRRITRRVLASLEAALPPAEEIVDFVRRHDPDAVVVTPLIALGTRQTDLLRAGRRLGVPSVGCIYSWDNLTSKGGVRDLPDLLAVWNSAQRREALEVHGVPGDRTAVTGAQGWDHWFDWRPSTTREEFAEKVGLRSDRPIVLYLGSGGFLVDGEPYFVPRWLDAVRTSDVAELREAGVLLRPHPHSPQPPWTELERLDDHVKVFPRTLGMPATLEARNDYFDSIYHSSAVVGLNTSAFVESAIVGRPVLCLQLPEFHAAQGGTLHFRHLVREGGGMLRLADSLEEHRTQLAEEVSSRAAPQRAGRFLEAFVRPYGLDEPATPRLVGVIESLAAERSGRRADPPSARLVAARALLRPVAALVLLFDGRGKAGGGLERLGRRASRVPRRLRRRGRRSVRRARRSARRGVRLAAAVRASHEARPSHDAPERTTSLETESTTSPTRAPARPHSRHGPGARRRRARGRAAS